MWIRSELPAHPTLPAPGVTALRAIMPRGNRTGFTLFEMTLALALVVTFFGILAPLLITLSRHQEATSRAHFARVQASNLLDELTHCPAEDLAERCASLQASAQARCERELPGVAVRLLASDEETSWGGRAVSCQIRWKDRTGIVGPAVNLTAWYLPATGDQP